ncbi:MAG: 50S ribosomal protein L5 [Candidatus Brocadiia bacterium]
MARLMDRYKNEIVPALKEQLKCGNSLAVPKIEKIVVSMGLGKAVENKDRVEAAVKDMSIITGQKPVVTKARISVANFKLRKGESIGCKVTLRHKMMYEFLDRLISIVLPRQRDFRGIPKKSFDKFGNYNMGISEQTVFPEITLDNVQFPQGMDITIVIKSPSVEASYLLLKALGMPFRD